MSSGELITRRGLVGTAAVATAAGYLGIAADPALTAAAAAPHCEVRAAGVRRNAIAVTADGRTLWTADTGATTISAFRTRGAARRRVIDVGAPPLDIALSRSGRHALVTTGFYDKPGLVSVDLHSGKVIGRIDVGPAAYSVALAHDDRTAYVAGGGDKGVLRWVDHRTGRVRAALELGRDPRGLAITLDGRHALIALNGESTVALVALAKHQLVGKIPTAPFPYLLAASPDGDHLHLTHNGFGATTVSVLDPGARHVVHHHASAVDPAGLAFAGRGALLVTERGAGSVAVLDPRSGRRRRRIVTGGFPRAIAVHGRRAFIADEQTGQLHTVRVR